MSMPTNPPTSKKKSCPNSLWGVGELIKTRSKPASSGSTGGYLSSLFLNKIFKK